MKDSVYLRAMSFGLLLLTALVTKRNMEFTNETLRPLIGLGFQIGFLVAAAFAWEKANEAGK